MRRTIPDKRTRQDSRNCIFFDFGRPAAVCRGAFLQRWQKMMKTQKEWGYFAGEQNALWKKFNKGVKKMGRVYEQLIKLVEEAKG